MNFIRTIDKIYEIDEKEMISCPNDDGTTDVYYRLESNKLINRNDVIKVSAKLEDLVDGFWWENEIYDDPIFIPNYGLAIDRINSWKESDEKLKTNSLSRIKVYASIYIKNSGWKHIAKINIENGELELL